MAQTPYQTLAKSGAHLVLYSKKKRRPIRKGWIEESADLAELERHVASGGIAGVIPGSLGLLVVDVDLDRHGFSPEGVIELLGAPLLRCPSHTPGNEHLYYRNGGGKLPYRWIGGEVLGSTRGAVLYGDAAERLVTILGQVEGAEPPNLALLPKPERKDTKRAQREVETAPEGERNNTLYQSAVRYATRGKNARDLLPGAVAAGLSREEATETIASAVKRVSSMRPPWVVVGDYYANRHWKDTARHVEGAGAPVWWAWTDDYWRPLNEKDHAIHHHLDRQRFGVAQELVDANEQTAAELLGNPKEWRAERATPAGEFWAGMAGTLKGSEPAPSMDHFAAANGLVDLRTGELVGHLPEHETRSVAAGNYLPQSKPLLTEALQRRLQGVLSPGGIEGFIDLVALGMTGRAQNYRAVLWLWGRSGTGKGGILQLISAALGNKALPRGRSFLEHSQGDIDDALADVLEKQPLFILIDEVGSSSKALNEGKSLSRFGDSPQSARRPHGRTITGTLRAMLVLTTVTAPTLSGKRGWERRSAVLGTLAAIPTKRKESGITQDLKDAVITLAALRAREVLEAMAMGTYTEPVGDPQRAKEFLAEADPVGEWLEALPDKCDGMLMKDLAEKANEELDPDKEFKAQGFGKRVAVSVKWKRHISSSGIRSIKLKKQPAEVEDRFYCAGPCEGMYTAAELTEWLCVWCEAQSKVFALDPNGFTSGLIADPNGLTSASSMHAHNCTASGGWCHQAAAGILPMDCPECKSHLREHEDEVPPPKH